MNGRDGAVVEEDQDQDQDQDQVQGQYQLSEKPIKASHLASGTFGIVDLATYDRKRVVTKRQTFDEANEDLENELKVFSEIKTNGGHPNIVEFIGFYEEPAVFMLVMAYLNGGTLDAYIKQEKRQVPEVVPFLQQVASAIDFIHKLGLVYRDLKPQNIMLDNTSGNTTRAVIVDAGSTLPVDSEQFIPEGMTLPYVNPDDAYLTANSKSVLTYYGQDVYAFGLMMLAVVNQGEIYKTSPGERLSSVVFLVSYMHRKRLPLVDFDGEAEEYKQLASECSKFSSLESKRDEGLRPSMASVTRRLGLMNAVVDPKPLCQTLEPGCGPQVNAFRS